MKKIFSKLTLIGLIGLMFSCSENENIVDFLFDETTRGVVLRTLDSSLELPEGTQDEFFTVLELQGTPISNVDRLEVYVDFTDNTPENGTTNLNEELFQTINASEFTTDERLPRTEVRFNLADLEQFFGITQNDYKGGDRFIVRYELHLNDGRIFTNTNTSATISGPFYRSPFRYSAPIICPVGDAFTGEYTVESYSPAGPFGGQWTIGATVNIEMGAGQTNRQFAVSWLGFNTTFRFDVLCGNLVVPKTSMGIGCSAVGIYYGPSPDGSVGTYDYTVGEPITDDETITIQFTDNADGDCGSTPKAQTVVLKKT